MPRGGKRAGAGRPKKSPTKAVRVPLALVKAMEKAGLGWADVLALVEDAGKVQEKPVVPAESKHEKRTKIKTKGWVYTTRPGDTITCTPDGDRWKITQYGDVMGWLMLTDYGWTFQRGGGWPDGFEQFYGSKIPVAWSGKQSPRQAFAHWLAWTGRRPKEVKERLRAL